MNNTNSSKVGLVWAIVIAIIVIIAGLVFVQTQKVKTVVKNGLVSNWKEFSAYPYPDEKLTIKYPTTWDYAEYVGTEICQDKDAYKMGVGTTTSNVPGTDGGSLFYLVSFCVSPTKTVLSHNGFVKVNVYPTPNVYINLPNDVLEKTEQYKIAQEIIAANSTNTAAISAPISDGAHCSVNITITSPNGGESYKAGDTMTVIWSDAGITKQYLTMKVLNEQGKDSPLSPASHRLTQLNNVSHKFIWQIPKDMVAGKYKVSIETVGKGTACDLPSDMSDNYFNITN